MAIDAKRCWLCNAALGADGGEAASTGEARAVATAALGSFSLSTLMLFVTLVAVVFGVISIAPGAGIVLGLVLLPVLAQTAIMAHRQEAAGHVLRPAEKIQLFLGSIGLVMLAGFAAAIAFGISCFAGFWAGAAVGEQFSQADYGFIAWGATVGIGLGSVVGAYVGYRALVILTTRWGIYLSPGNKRLLGGAIILAVVGALLWIVFGNVF